MTCRTCGAPYAGYGDGWDGECGTCADRTAPAPLPSILDRVRKLLAHAESAAGLGSQAEADAFATKAAGLMRQHHIDAAALGYEGPVETLGRDDWAYCGDNAREHVGWKASLAYVIAKANFCTMVRSARQTLTGQIPVLVLLGKPSDQAVVRYLWDVLVRSADRCARQYPGDRAERQQFRLGFVHAIGARLAEHKRTADATATGSALVVLNDAARQLSVYLRQQFPRLSNVRSGANASSGSYAAGRAAGAAEPIRSGVRGSGSGSARPLALGAG